ncbi:MAG: MOSC domain-containing protein [Sulfurospirillum sp.]
MKEEVLGKVIDTFSVAKDGGGLPRPRVEKLVLTEGYGIENDKFAGDELHKTVMIIGLKSYKMAKEKGIELKQGSYGENILFDFDPHLLNISERLQIGKSIIEITEKCTLCNHLSVFGTKLPKLIKNHRGLYCKIIKSGEITKAQAVLKVSA